MKEIIKMEPWVHFIRKCTQKTEGLVKFIFMHGSSPKRIY